MRTTVLLFFHLYWLKKSGNNLQFIDFRLNYHLKPIRPIQLRTNLFSQTSFIEKRKVYRRRTIEHFANIGWQFLTSMDFFLLMNTESTSLKKIWCAYRARKYFPVFANILCRNLNGTFSKF
jgi:hypothetical protein